MTTASALRRLLMIIFILGSIGTGAELLLAGHTEDYWQLVPLGLIALSFVVLIGHAILRNAAVLKVFRLVTALFILSGVIGIWQHYQARAEFKMEGKPDLHGLRLFGETIVGATLPPLLAPGVMIQIGLLGFACTFRHPLLVSSVKKKSSQPEQ